MLAEELNPNSVFNFGEIRLIPPHDCLLIVLLLSSHTPERQQIGLRARVARVVRRVAARRKRLGTEGAVEKRKRQRKRRGRRGGRRIGRARRLEAAAVAKVTRTRAKGTAPRPEEEEKKEKWKEYTIGSMKFDEKW